MIDTTEKPTKQGYGDSAAHGAELAERMVNRLKKDAQDALGSTLGREVALDHCQNLSLYELACGGLQRHELDGIRTTLWQEHEVFHVRQHDFNEHKRLFWEVFNRLDNAQRCYNRAIKANKIS